MAGQYTDAFLHSSRYSPALHPPSNVPRPSATSDAARPERMDVQGVDVPSGAGSSPLSRSGAHARHVDATSRVWHPPPGPAGTLASPTSSAALGYDPYFTSQHGTGYPFSTISPPRHLEPQSQDQWPHNTSYMSSLTTSSAQDGFQFDASRGAATYAMLPPAVVRQPYVSEYSTLHGAIDAHPHSRALVSAGARATRQAGPELSQIPSGVVVSDSSSPEVGDGRPGGERSTPKMEPSAAPSAHSSVPHGVSPPTPTSKPLRRSSRVHSRVDHGGPSSAAHAPTKSSTSPQPPPAENVEAEVDGDSDADAEGEDDPDVVRVGDVKGKTSTSGKRKRPASPQWERRRPAKMHNCPECGKGFPRPSGLLTHMNVHTGRKRELHLSHFLRQPS
jgi:hypothetical protein